MWKKALLCVVVAPFMVATGLAGTPLLPESVLEQAFEKGCALAIVRILSTRTDDEKMHCYNVDIVRTIVAGDLQREEVERPLEVFAGASHGDALKEGACYAILIDHPCPCDFEWAWRDNAVGIDPNDKTAVRQLIGIADRVYARTEISRFRRSSMEPAAKPAQLPEELASLCDRFRKEARERGELGKRIGESDLGSKVDPSKPRASDGTYLPPRISCSRREMLSLLGYPGWKNGRTYCWYGELSQLGGSLIGVLSVGFDSNDRSMGAVYSMQKRSKWVGRTIPASAMAEAEGDPAGVAAGFQQALRDSDWTRALSFCSPSVQAKAKEAESPEAFFRRCVPIEGIVARTFKPHWFSSRGGRTVAISDRVDLSGPQENQAPIEWEWKLLKVGSIWQVDIDAMPLDRYTEKEQVKREAQGRTRLTAREGTDRAIKYVLSPVGSEFVIGRPMLFRLEMKNEGATAIAFRRTSVSVNDPMRVIDPDGKELPYVDTSYQTTVRTDAILAGEAIVLEDKYDVASQYRIVHPGRHQFQFRSQNRVSNICEVDVKPGPLPAFEQLVDKLVPALPAGWRWDRRFGTPPDMDTPDSADWLFITITGRSAGKENPYRAFFLTVMGGDPAETDPWMKRDMAYWGLSRWGPVYAAVNEIESLWPECRKTISAALEIPPAN
jgi:hypothetical protein